MKNQSEELKPPESFKSDREKISKNQKPETKLKSNFHNKEIKE